MVNMVDNLQLTKSALQVTVCAIGFAGEYMGKTLDGPGVDDQSRKYMRNRVTVNAISFAGEYMVRWLDG